MTRIPYSPIKAPVALSLTFSKPHAQRDFSREVQSHVRLVLSKQREVGGDCSHISVLL